ncbi:MAG: ChrR family anti-sigma-E factor [Alphaproteobacteria bacterium]|nr:ChrR family anti-sigma-E factor [Alphaproteobacteria bacterium]
MTTVTPIHHPHPQLLSAQASGALSPAVNRIIAAHAALCPHCRTTLNRLETVGGALLDDQPVAPLDDGALEKALAAISTPPVAVQPPALPQELSALPLPLRDIISAGIGKATWQSVGTGLRCLELELPTASAGESFQVFRIEPGSGPPRHTHGGQEFTLVLTGAFKDETGLYRRGDIAIGNESITHRPIAEPGEVCFALAVSTAPIKFKGPLGLLQRVLNLGRG